MLPDRVSNPGPLAYESGALLIALRGPAKFLVTAPLLTYSITNETEIEPLTLLQIRFRSTGCCPKQGESLFSLASKFQFLPLPRKC